MPVICKRKTVQPERRRQRHAALHKNLVERVRRMCGVDKPDWSKSNDITFPLQIYQRCSPLRRYFLRRQRQQYDAHLRELVKRGMELEIDPRIPIFKRLSLV